MKRFGSITVRELIEALEDHDPDMVVTFQSDYGDHGHTQQVHSIDGNIEEKWIEQSAYSGSGYAVMEDGDGDPESPEYVNPETDELVDGEHEKTGHCVGCGQQVGNKHKADCEKMLGRIEFERLTKVLVIV